MEPHSQLLSLTKSSPLYEQQLAIIHFLEYEGIRHLKSRFEKMFEEGYAQDSVQNIKKKTTKPSFCHSVLESTNREKYLKACISNDYIECYNRRVRLKECEELFDQREKSRQTNRYDNHSSSFESEEDTHWIVQQFHKALGTLSKRQSEIFILRFIKGMRNEDVATQLDLSVHHVAKVATEAMQKFRLTFPSKQEILDRFPTTVPSFVVALQITLQ